MLTRRKASRHRRTSDRNLRRRRTILERLEDRRLLTLITPSLILDFPAVSANSTGTVEYTASSGKFVAKATPIVFFETMVSGPTFFDPFTIDGLNLEFSVLNVPVGGEHLEKSEGDLVGITGDDFTLEGSIPGVTTGTEVLLTGEVLEFGYDDAPGSETDKYDFRIEVTGGTLKSIFTSNDSDEIGLKISSENSSFNGNFDLDFSGGNKSSLGPVDAGDEEVFPASLGDFVWHDLDADGIQDTGEPGINGATVKLIGGGADGVIGTGGDDTLETTTTDTFAGNDGFYEFTNLMPGVEYQVMFVQPGGFDSVSPLNAGSNDTVDSDADPSDSLKAPIVTLASNEHNPTIDAGFYNTASLGDFVWHDLNGDGIQDTGEPGISGAAVNLKDSSGTVINSTITAADGSYSFTDLIPGTYSVQFVQPAGFSEVSPLNAGGDDAVDSDADPAMSLMTATTTLASGDNDPTLDAGFYNLASLGDFVWHDLDGDGIQDAGEPGISGAAVNLKDSSGTVINSTITAADGSYSFTDLIPGTYSVQFVQPAGFSEVSPLNAGGDDALDSDADPAMSLMTATTTLASGDNDPTLDAGFYNLDIDIEKYVRVDEPPVPPLDIEKLVRVVTPGGGEHGQDLCAALNDLATLTFTYTGGNDLSNTQEGKASVTGTLSDPAPNSVYIVGTNKNNDVYFQGDVDFNESFDMTATNAGLSKFGASTFVTIYAAAGGAVLQSIAVHTSCSKPINLGDVFGGVTLTGAGDVSGNELVISDPNPNPDLGPGIDDDDADSPTGPTATVGDTVVWTYVVTNSGDAAIENVVVTDDNETLNQGDDFNPDPVLDGMHNVGDVNPQDGKLSPGEVWLYTANLEIAATTALGQHRNVGKVIGDYKGGQVMDDDPAHFINPELPPAGSDLCQAKLAVLTFEYTGTNELSNTQEGKASFSPDLPNPAPTTVHIVGTNKSNDVYFQGDVDINETFDMTAANAGASQFGASTFISIYDTGGNLLQSIAVHTSCSKPINLLDIFGGVTLVGAVNVNGGVIQLPGSGTTDQPGDQGTVLLGPTFALTPDDPFNPGDIGVDADDPTGPIAQPGDKITFTFVVTNPGTVPLTNVVVTDNTGVTVEEVTKPGGGNIGDIAPADNQLNHGETWYYQAMEIADEPGQQMNIGKVTANPDMVMDVDPAHHFVNPLDIQKYTRGENENAGITGQDICDDFGLHDLSRLTFSYTGGNTLSNTQEGKASVTGTLSVPPPATAWIVGSNKSGDMYFNGEVDLNESFDMTAANAGVSKFGASTFIAIYSADPNANGTLLQSIEVHTSCSKPLALGDVFAGVTLVSAEDATGDIAELPDLGGDGGLGADADNPEDAVPIGLGETVIWTYAVTNLGGTEAMDNIVIVDDAGTPSDPSDDFSTTDGAILAVVDELGNNVGDDGNGRLDPGETWLYRATDIVREEGLYGNKATVTADLVLSNLEMMDMDMSHYQGTLPALDVCETDEKAAELSMRYTGSNTLSNSQSGKASVTGTLSDPPPATVYIVGTNKSNDIYFSGEVDLDEAFTMTAANAGLSKFGASTFVAIYASDGGALLQSIELHTSCSKPLALGDEFGGVQLVGFVGDGGTQLGIVPDAVPIATGSGIVSTDPVFHRNKLMITITNNGSTNAVINEMDFQWAISNKKLKKIKADKLTIYDVDTSFSSGGLAIGAADWEGGTLAVRTLEPGESVILKFEFEKRASDNVVSYGLVIRFDLNNDGDSDDEDEEVHLF